MEKEIQKLSKQLYNEFEGENIQLRKEYMSKFKTYLPRGYKTADEIEYLAWYHRDIIYQYDQEICLELLTKDDESEWYKTFSKDIEQHEMAVFLNTECNFIYDFALNVSKFL